MTDSEKPSAEAQKAASLLWDMVFGPLPKPGGLTIVDAEVVIQAAITEATAEVVAERDKWGKEAWEMTQNAWKATQERDEARAAAGEMWAALAALEPYLDAIICYASTMGEHAPNQFAADGREAIHKHAAYAPEEPQG